MNGITLHTLSVLQRRSLSQLLPCLALFLFLFLCATPQSFAQSKTLAQYESKSSNGVSNATNVNTDDNTYATVKTYGGIAVGIGSYPGSIQMKFNQTIPANQWSYIRVELDGGLTDALLGGGLGDLLGDAVSSIALGDLTIEVSALDASNNVVLQRSSDQGFGTDRVRLIKTGEGYVLIALKPSQDYNRLKFKASISTLLLGTTFTNKVYYAFTYDQVSTLDCGRPLATSFEGSGVDVDVLNLGNQNLGNAIDNDTTTYSNLKAPTLLNVNLGATFSQLFYFSSTSANTTSVNLKIGLGSGGVINTDLLGAIQVILYDDSDAVVYSRSLQGSLLNNTDALNLLNSGQPVTVSFVPGREFNRMEVRLNSPVGLGLAGSAVKIYDVQRYNSADGCVNPNIRPLATVSQNPFDVPSCSSSMLDFANTDYAQRAVDGNNESYASIYADAGSLLVNGPTAGYITFDMGARSAGQTTYIRIDYDDQVLDKLLGGSLGKVVDSLVGNLLLGKQYIQVQVYSGTNTTPVLDAESSDAFAGNANGSVAVVQDEIGRYYLAVTPNAAYTKIKLSNHVTAVLPTGTQSSLDVYEACFEIGTDPCFPANFTAYYGNGLNLSLANISNVGVTNPDRAIDGNSSSYSEINLGVAGVVASVYQSIYFNKPSQANDTVAIRMMIEPSSALSLDVLGGYEIKFYNGSQLVESHTLQEGLINNLGLLALFNSGGVVELKYVPTATFDRVDIGAASTLQLNVATSPLRVYSVKRYGTACPLPTTPFPFDSPSCATFLVDAQNADDVQNLFDDDFDSHATLKSGAGILLGLGNQYEGYVEMSYPMGTTMSAGTTSYIRIDFDSNILDALLSGTLGDVASDLLGGLALGDHYFEVIVKNNTYDANGKVTNSTTIASASSDQAATGGMSHMRIVQDKLGRYYIAVTPTQDYNAIRIVDHTDSALGLLAQPNTMNVYGMCTELSADSCLDAFATSFEYGGVNLGTSGIGAAGVKNAANAIDDNTTNYSEISIGTVGVLGSAKQWIYFNTLSPANDVVMIDFKTQGGAVDLSVLGGIEVIAYNGNTPVDTLDWQNGIVNGVNVLNLISNNQHVQVPFTPSVQYDRISVGLSTTLISANVLPALHLYQVQRCYSLGSPDYVTWKSYEIDGDPSLSTVQGGESVAYTIHIKNTGGVDIAGVKIEDPLPMFTTYVSGGTNTGGTVTFDNITVLVGQTVTKTFTVKVNDNLSQADTISNVALVKLSAGDPGTETFPPLSNDPTQPDTSGPTGTDIPVDQIQSVVMWKAYDVNGDNTVTEVSGGETVNYHLYVRNTGNQDLTNLVVSDALPAGMTYVSGGNFNGGTVSFTVANLAVGATAGPLTFSATVDQDLTGITKLKNIATAQPDPNATTPTESYPPVDNTNPTDPDTTAPPGTVLDVTPIHDITVAKNGVSNSATPGQVQVGDQVTYTITVKNTGNEELTNVLVEDVLSAAYTNLSASYQGNPLTGVFTGNTFTYTLSSVAVGATETVTIVAEVANINPANLDANANVVNTADITYRNSDNTTDVTESATDKLPTSCTPIIDTEIDLGSALTVCAEEGFSIAASYTGSATLTNPVYKWYKTSALSDVPFVGATLADTLSTTTTYYVTLEADGHCVNVTPAQVTVTVNPLPDVPSVTAVGNRTQICAGETIGLVATLGTSNPANTDATFEWYKDGVLIAGVANDTIQVTDAASYTAVAISNSTCASAASAPVAITVNPRPLTPSIDQSTPIEICEGQTDTLTTSAVADEYRWYYNGTPVTIDTVSGVVNYYNTDHLVVSKAGNYAVQVFDNTMSCGSEQSSPVQVIVNPLPTIDFRDGDMLTVGIDSIINWQTVVDSIIVSPSTASLTWYDDQQNAVTPLSLPNSYSSAGVKTFYLVAENGGCSIYKAFRVNVYDPTACPTPMRRVYAIVDGGWGSIITGGVSNTGNAVDGNPKTHSTITTGLGLLGVGTTWQNVKFDHTVPAGTPVTIKLGKEYSGLVLAGGLSVVGIGTNGLDIGVLQPVQGGLLDLLAADNVVTYTFIPRDILGNPQPYTGVRISQGALLSVAQNVKVFGVYYEEPGQPSCGPVATGVKPYVQDVYHGVKDLGLGVASATASVVDAWNAVDADLNTSTKIVRGVSVLNAAFLTVEFKNQVMPTDSLQILMEDPTQNGVTLDLLTGYQFQRYLGGSPVGDPIQGGNVLDLRLFDITSGKAKLRIASYNQPYDRLQITYGSVVEAQLGDQVRIYDIAVIPAIENAAGDTSFEVCQGDLISIKQQDPCTIYKVFDEDDNLLATQNNLDFIVPTQAAIGTHSYFVQAIRQGCGIGPRQEIEVTVNPRPVFSGFTVDDGTVSVGLSMPYQFQVDPGNHIVLTPTIDTQDPNNVLPDVVFWEMLNPHYDPQNPSAAPQWIPIGFGTYDNGGTLTMDIPGYGLITLPDGSVYDIRNKDVTLRLTAKGVEGCTQISDPIVMHVSGNSKLISNPNIINRL